MDPMRPNSHPTPSGHLAGQRAAKQAAAAAAGPDWAAKRAAVAALSNGHAQPPMGPSETSGALIRRGLDAAEQQRMTRSRIPRPRVPREPSASLQAPRVNAGL